MSTEIIFDSVEIPTKTRASRNPYIDVVAGMEPGNGALSFVVPNGETKRTIGRLRLAGAGRVTVNVHVEAFDAARDTITFWATSKVSRPRRVPTAD